MTIIPPKTNKREGTSLKIIKLKIIPKIGNSE